VDAVSAFDAAAMILTETTVAEWTAKHVNHETRTVSWDEIAALELYLSSSGYLLVNLALQLYNGSRRPLVGESPVTVADVVEKLDHGNLVVVLGAIQMRRGVSV
jgi:hypothetical protein